MPLLHDLYCPACGQGALWATHSLAGMVLECLGTECPDPNRAAELLGDSDINHVVVITHGPGEVAFEIKHPLREHRQECPLSAHLVLQGPPRDPDNERDCLPDGRYRVRLATSADEWVWEVLP